MSSDVVPKADVAGEVYDRKRVLYSFLGAIAAAVLTGTGPIWIRVSSIGEISTAMYRFLIAIPFLAILHICDEPFEDKYRDTRITPQEWRMIIITLVCIGFGQGIAIILSYFGTNMTSVALASILVQTSIFWAPLFAIWVFRERFGLFWVVGLVLTLAGLLLVLVGDDFSTLLSGFSTDDITGLIGDGLSLASGIVFAMNLIAFKYLRRYLRVGPALFWPTAISALMCFCGALAAGETFIANSWQGWLVLFANSVLVQVIGGILYVLSVKHCPAGLFALTAVVSTIVSVFLAWILFKETMSLPQLVGVAVCLVGLFFAQVRAADIGVKTNCFCFWKKQTNPYGRMD